MCLVATKLLPLLDDQTRSRGSFVGGTMVIAAEITHLTTTVLSFSMDPHRC